jgi:hypothetical protein
MLSSVAAVNLLDDHVGVFCVKNLSVCAFHV